MTDRMYPGYMDGYPGMQQYPTEPPEEGSVAQAGEALEPGTAVAAKEAVADAMRTVFDPEIPVNIYELGLIYDYGVAENGDVSVKMTLTAPTCPVAGILPGQVAEAIAKVPGTGEVSVELTWEPPWDPSMMSEEAKLELNMY